MQTKAFQVVDLKTSRTRKGEFEATVSVYDNVDRVSDRVKSGAFDRTLSEKGLPPIVWSHQWEIPPIGQTLDAGNTSKGLGIKGLLFVDDDDNHQYADMAYAAMKSRVDGQPPALREFSFSYDIAEGGSKWLDEGGKRVRELTDLELYEVGPCLVGCNPATTLDQTPKSFGWRALAAKGYGDIEWLSISYLLDMIEDAASFIYYEDDADDVTAMRGVVTTLVDMLNTEVQEQPDPDALAAQITGAYGYASLDRRMKDLGIDPLVKTKADAVRTSPYADPAYADVMTAFPRH